MGEQKKFHSVRVTTMEKKENHSNIQPMVDEYRRVITGRIKFLMRKRHIGQDQLASLMGIPQSHVSRIVTGKLNVTVDNLIKMLYYLDGSIDFCDDQEQSIAVYWQSHLEWLKDYKDLNDERRERYTLKYINSRPTLLAV